MARNPLFKVRQHRAIRGGDDARDVQQHRPGPELRGGATAGQQPRVPGRPEARARGGPGAHQRRESPQSHGALVLAGGSTLQRGRYREHVAIETALCNCEESLAWDATGSTLQLRQHFAIARELSPVHTRTPPPPSAPSRTPCSCTQRTPQSTLGARAFCLRVTDVKT